MNRFEEYEILKEKFEGYKEKIEYVNSELVSLEREILIVMLNLDLTGYEVKKSTL